MNEFWVSHYANRHTFNFNLMNGREGKYWNKTADYMKEFNG